MMTRVLFYILKFLALVLKATRGRNAYMTTLVRAHRIRGVEFTGTPRYIHPNVMLDPSGGLHIGNNVVISTNVIVLTHDYSITAAMASVGERPQCDHAIMAPVQIGENSFLGAGVIVLPGTTIAKNVIIGAGSVAVGNIPENTVAVGSPATAIATTDSWLKRKKTLPDKHWLHVDGK